MIHPIIFSGVLGALGGLTRGVLGLFKAITKSKKILWEYWGVTIVISMIVGSFTGVIFSFDYRMALLAGYAGTDVLEGVYKSFSAQKVFVPRKTS